MILTVVGMNAVAAINVQTVSVGLVLGTQIVAVINVVAMECVERTPMDASIKQRFFVAQSVQLHSFAFLVFCTTAFGFVEDCLVTKMRRILLR